jgi:four helix bundle protein
MAEGSSPSSKTDFARFIEISSGSLFEVVSQAFIAKRQGFLKDEQFQKLYQAAEEQSRMQRGLRKSLFL